MLFGVNRQNNKSDNTNNLLENNLQPKKNDSNNNNNNNSNNMSVIYQFRHTVAKLFDIRASKQNCIFVKLD